MRNARDQSVRSTSSVSARVLPRRSIPALLLAALLLAALCILWSGPVKADEDDEPGGDFVPRQVVVKLAPTAKIGAINNKYDTRTLEKLLGSRKIYLLRTPKGESPETVANQMRNDPKGRIIYAEPNFRTSAPEGKPRAKAWGIGEPQPSSNPAPYRDQYAIGQMSLPGAHGITRGKGTVVAVLDTGAQLGHPELAGGFTDARYDFVGDDRWPVDSKNGKDDDGDGQVDEMAGHGTHVAGIVNLAAPRAKIMPVRVLDSDGRGNVFVLAEALHYSANNGADVINLSLGASRQSDLIEDIIENVTEGDEGFRGGTVVVAAAGNENTNERQYPAATGYEKGDGKDYEESPLAVTSVNRNEVKSRWANYGPWVDVAAPGSSIYSTFPESRYALWEGTSMATPFVSGQAALMYRYANAGESEDKVACISRIILNTARPLSDRRLGEGHADAEAGVRYIRSNGCPAGDGEGDD